MVVVLSLDPDGVPLVVLSASGVGTCGSLSGGFVEIEAGVTGEA